MGKENVSRRPCESVGMYMVSKLEFNNKKQCGLWLIAVGIVLVFSVMFGGRYIVNPFIFVAGYYFSFFMVNVNKYVRNKLSQGSISGFQLRMIYISLGSLFLLLFAIAGPFFIGWRFRMIWLGVLLATAIHFFLWFFIHGYSMIVLGCIGIAIALTGYLIPEISVSCLYIIDALSKLLMGCYLLFISKPTEIKFLKRVKI